MKRLWFQGINIPCDRPGCRHLLRGEGKAGHFNMGAGPCKVAHCTCAAFLKLEAKALPPAQAGPAPPGVGSAPIQVAPPLLEAVPLQPGFPDSRQGFLHAQPDADACAAPAA